MPEAVAMPIPHTKVLTVGKVHMEYQNGLKEWTIMNSCQHVVLLLQNLSLRLYETKHGRHFQH